jgi:hypothetical protein
VVVRGVVKGGPVVSPGFLRGVRARGLAGISTAIREAFPGAFRAPGIGAGRRPDTGRFRGACFKARSRLSIGRACGRCRARICGRVLSRCGGRVGLVLGRNSRAQRGTPHGPRAALAWCRSTAGATNLVPRAPLYSGWPAGARAAAPPRNGDLIRPGCRSRADGPEARIFGAIDRWPLADDPNQKNFRLGLSGRRAGARATNCPMPERAHSALCWRACLRMSDSVPFRGRGKEVSSLFSQPLTGAFNPPLPPSLRPWSHARFRRSTGVLTRFKASAYRP